jgi:hypothetical protein
VIVRFFCGRHQLRGGAISQRREHAELVAAHAIGAAPTRGCPLEPRGEPPQQGIPGRVPERVVVRLEAIEVEHAEQQRLTQRGVTKGTLEVRHQAAAVA